MNNTYLEVFIGTVGITPQIVTEALYYYYSQSPPRVFNRIILLTTRTGKDCLHDTLFNQGKLKQLELILGLVPGTIPLTPKDIFLFHDQDGQELEDIRTDSASFHEFADIFDVISKQVSDPQTRLTVTIAGGRKTMSVAVGLAMQVFARSQDEMIHILVKPPFDQRRDWFFPEDPEDPDQSIDIIKIPFLRIQPYLPESLVKSKNVMEIISSTQSQLDLNRPIREVKVVTQYLIVDGQEIRFPPKEMSLWRWLARQKIEHCVRPDRLLCDNCRECWVEHSTLVEMYNMGIFKEYELIVGPNSHRVIDRKMKKYTSALDITEVLRQIRSKFNNSLEKRTKLPFLQKQALKISTEGRYIKQYGLLLEKGVLTIVK